MRYCLFNFQHDYTKITGRYLNNRGGGGISSELCILTAILHDRLSLNSKNINLFVSKFQLSSLLLPFYNMVLNP